VGNYRVESHYLRFAADELRRYQGRKHSLRVMEDSVIRGTSITDNLGMPRGTDVSNPTHNAAMRLMDVNDPTFKRRAHLRVWVNSTDELLRSLPNEQQQIIRLIYWEGDLTILGVARRLNMAMPTVNRHRNAALLAFAVHVIGDQILIPLEH